MQLGHFVLAIGEVNPLREFHPKAKQEFYLQDHDYPLGYNKTANWQKTLTENDST